MHKALEGIFFEAGIFPAFFYILLAFWGGVLYSARNSLLLTYKFFDYYEQKRTFFYGLSAFAKFVAQRAGFGLW